MIHLRSLICGILACRAVSGYANPTSENPANQSCVSNGCKELAKKDSPSEVSATRANPRHKTAIKNAPKTGKYADKSEEAVQPEQVSGTSKAADQRNRE